MDTEKIYAIKKVNEITDKNTIQKLAEICDDITRNMKGMSKRNIIACIKRMDFWGEFTRFMFQCNKLNIIKFGNSI